MSDFLFARGGLDADRLAAILSEFMTPVDVVIDDLQGEWGSLAVARRRQGAQVEQMDDSGVSAVAGEPLVSLPGIPRGPLRREGRRAGVHALLCGGGGEWARVMDGMWAGLGTTTEGDPVRVVTDRFGFVPVYHADLPDGGFVVGTHVDAVARAAGRDRDHDPVSLADLLVNLTCTYPFTPYRGVRQLPPGSEIELPSRVERGYWRPLEISRFSRLDEAAVALREGVRDDLRAACEGAERVGILLSGGEDSRALLGAFPAGVHVDAFTLSSGMNREARVARRVASAYGAGFMLGRREPDHYEAGMEAVARLIGSMHLFMDVHGYGLHRQMALHLLPVVVGGLSADSLLKANYAPAVDAGGALHPLPPTPGIRPELVAAVAERRSAFLAWLREIRPESALEWSVLYPFSMRKHGANVHGNRRLFAAHEAYHCNASLDVAAAAPVAWKRDRRLFVQAVRPFLARSWNVPHARSRYPYFGTAPNWVLGALLRSGRIVRDLFAGEITARQGGWPKWSEVAGSAATAAAWGRFPPEASSLREVFQPGTPPLAALREVHPLRQMMALQLASLLRDDVR